MNKPAIDIDEFINDILSMERENLLLMSDSSKTKSNLPAKILDLYEERCQGNAD
ncbi:MAG: hypothetical protein MR773_01925 [Eubacterium coprostanoligenes]|nr:hypothetical protein [Eubacterium coprostanoligenes]